MQGCTRATTFEQVAKALRALLEKHEAGDLKINTSGRRAALDRYGKGRPLKDLDERLRALLI
jgi:hypothetical protein